MGQLGSSQLVLIEGIYKPIWYHLTYSGERHPGGQSGSLDSGLTEDLHRSTLNKQRVFLVAAIIVRKYIERN